MFTFINIVVNTRNSGKFKYRGMSSSDTKVLGVRVPDNFPLTGKDVKLLLSRFDDIVYKRYTTKSVNKVVRDLLEFLKKC